MNRYRAFEIEICNACGGLVGWERVRDGVCLGGVVCKREQGTRLVPQPPEGAVEAGNAMYAVLDRPEHYDRAAVASVMEAWLVATLDRRRGQSE